MFSPQLLSGKNTAHQSLTLKYKKLAEAFISTQNYPFFSSIYLWQTELRTFYAQFYVLVMVYVVFKTGIQYIGGYN
jgi:hypothetical protein